MRVWHALVLLAAAPATRALAPAVLNQTALDHLLRAHDAALFFVYVPWCDHSRTMQPHVAQAARDVRAALEASGGGKSCGFGVLDASENDETASLYGIEGYPTLLLLRSPYGDAGGVAGGDSRASSAPPLAAPHREYRGERTAAAITAWALGQLEPKLPIVRSAAEVRALLSAPEQRAAGGAAAGEGGAPVAAVVALLPPGHEAALLEAVRLAAAELDSVPWLLCSSADAAQIGRELLRGADGAAGASGEGGGGGDSDLSLPALIVLGAMGGEPSVLPLAPWDGPASGWKPPRAAASAAARPHGQPGADAVSGAAADARDDPPGAAMHRLGAHLAEWADAHLLPVLVPYTEASAERIFGARADFHAMLVHAGPSRAAALGASADGPPSSARGARPAGRGLAGAEGAAALPAPVLSAVRSAAASLRGPFAFATISASDFPDFAAYAGLRAEAPDDLPALAVLQPTTGKKWVFRLAPAGSSRGDGDDATATTAATAVRSVAPESIGGLLAQIRAGALQPSLRSAPPRSPAPQPAAGRVTELVGSDYEAAILNPRIHVLCYVYAPWCGHCRRFDRVFEQLAAALGGVESVALVKLDGAANELPGLTVGAYPSVFLFARDNKAEPVEFTGARSLADLAEFVLAELHDDEHERLAHAIERVRRGLDERGPSSEPQPRAERGADSTTASRAKAEL